MNRLREIAAEILGQTGMLLEQTGELMQAGSELLAALAVRVYPTYPAPPELREVLDGYLSLDMDAAMHDLRVQLRRAAANHPTSWYAEGGKIPGNDG